MSELSSLSRLPRRARIRSGNLVFLSLLLVCCQRSSSASAPERVPGSRSAAAAPLSEPVYAGGLVNGWQDFGWSPRELPRGAPARVEFSNKGGWILAKPDYAARPGGGLRLRFRAPARHGDFLEIRLDSPGGVVFPRVRVGPQHRRDLADGWSEVWLSLSELNPRAAAFDRVVLRAAADVGPERVELDEVGFTAEAPRGAAPEPAQRALLRDVEMRVDCRAPGHPISPAIYGIAFTPRLDAKTAHQWQLGATGRRWGGNSTSRYNWELGNAWNTASDWYYRNVNYTGNERYSYTDFLDDNLAHGVQTALTVPLIGWVAKDTRSHSFPVAQYGPQQAVDPNVVGAGNGLDRRGKPLPSPSPLATSVPATPDFVGRWVKAIRERDEKRGLRSVHMYILDNEPSLWHETHRDVRPEPLGYDELLQRTLDYGTAVRRADPEAVIAGPAEWGWTGYFYSGRDKVAGLRRAPDRAAHGGEPLLPWLLRKVREHERKTGTRILDVLDVHFYPQAKGVGVGERGATDPATNALRIRSTRALWDPTYLDESWIEDRIRLIPRLREWIARSAPGLAISIGEYSFGAEGHMSGGLALAEALGRFGEQRVDAAYYWTYPAANSPAFWAFRAFRNFDGQGARFLDHSVPARAGEGTSLFVSRDADGAHLVAVALNLDPLRAARARIQLGGCGTVNARRSFVYAGERAGLTEQADAAAAGSVLEQTLPPYSITVLDLRLTPPSRAAR